ncbi:hypothetical protein B0H19DRAFT_1269914 [Mycena capillaripes]|nr:hypothetical protein B0H19DRAFT_1269914 [Mycena capillaripes]
MPDAVDNAAVCPPGYTYAFLQPKYFVSIKGEKMAKNLIAEANFLRIYAKLALIDNTLAILHSKIVKKDWDAAFPILETLALFNEMEDDWPMCDDGKRVELTNKVYGASLVTVLRALKKDGRLDVSHFPSLETVLREAADWGSEMKSIGCESDYDLVCKATGARLFQKSAADAATEEKARLDAWLASRSQEERDEFQKMRREEAEDPNGEDSDEEEDAGLWHAEGNESEEDMKHDDFVLSRVWKEYKDYLDPEKRRGGDS